MKPDLEQAHGRSSHHRTDVLTSEYCGCFYCCRTFRPVKIREWTDFEGVEKDLSDGVRQAPLGQTAICPYCGIDAVLGQDGSVTAEFLSAMRARWFGDHPREGEIVFACAHVFAVPGVRCVHSPAGSRIKWTVFCFDCAREQRKESIFGVTIWPLEATVPIRADLAPKVKA